MDASVVPYLFLVTFVIALGLGIMQYRKARKARAEHHRSVSAKEQGEPYAPGGPQGD